MLQSADGRVIALKTTSGLTILTPATLSCATTYVILEQERWFEREVEFASRCLRPGMTAVDAAAGLGVYALPLAQAVGQEGQAIAFEADVASRALLEESRATNRLDQLTVEAPPATLDEALLDLERLDFLKLTAGDLDGATQTLARHDPLVLLGDMAAGEALAALGYSLFRMLGDGSMLVAWVEAEHDGSQINLLAAKPALAELLERQGLLARAPADPDLGFDGHELFHRLIARLHYLNAFGPMAPIESHDPHITALAAYEAWRDPARSAAERYGALRLAFSLFQQMCAAAPSPGRLSSLARVAAELGAFKVARLALAAQGQFRRPPCYEPFLAASPRFDTLNPGADAVDWFAAQVLEQGELLAAPSSFHKPSQQANLVWLAGDSFASAEMIRRLVLQYVRSGAPLTGLQPLLDARPHINAEALKPERLAELVDAPLPWAGPHAI